SAIKKCCGADLVKGRKRSCQFNGKVERFFRTFKIWKQSLLCAFRIAPLQRRMDIYREWYNTQRPMMLLRGRTPDEAWRGDALPPALATRENDALKPAINVTRIDFRGDTDLPQLCIRIVRSVKLIA